METSHPSTRAVNSGSGNRALHVIIALFSGMMLFGIHEYSYRIGPNMDLALAVLLSGNALALINVVALRLARLVLGCVTVCRYGI